MVACGGEGEPGDPAVVAGPGAAAGGELADEEQAVRGLGGADVAVPGAAVVLDLGQQVGDAPGAGAEDEESAGLCAGRVGDGVAAEFAGQQRSVIGGGEPGEE